MAGGGCRSSSAVSAGAPPSGLATRATRAAGGHLEPDSDATARSDAITTTKEKRMEFLVEFDVHVPDGARAIEVEVRNSAEATAAAKLVEEGHLVRLWKPPAAPGETKALGLYRADSEAQLTALLEALPLYDWMNITVTPLEPHPNDPVRGAMVSAAAKSQP